MSFPSEELRKFSQAGEALAKAANITVEQWAEAEAGQVLKGWAGLIGASTVPKAEKRARNRVLSRLGLTKGETTINSGVRGPEGRVWVRTARKRWRLVGNVSHNAGAFTPEHKHFSDDQWAASQRGVAQYQGQAGVIAMAKRTIGLARQSVVQIGDMIGIAIERIAGGSGGLSPADVSTARNAVASDGKTYQNGYGVRQRTDTSFSIELINRYPKIAEAKVDVALATAVGQRVNLFGKVLNEKLLSSTERVAKAFPYLQVGR